MYKDLSLKEKAKVIREGVRLGLNSIDDILSLYDDAIGHKFLGDTNSQMDNSSGVLKWNEELLDFVYSVPEVTVAYDLPKRNEDKSGFDKYVQSITNSYINGNINTNDVNKLPWLYRNAIIGLSSLSKGLEMTKSYNQKVREEFRELSNIPNKKKIKRSWLKTVYGGNRDYNDIPAAIDNIAEAEKYNTEVLKKEKQLDNWLSSNAGKLLNAYIPFFDPFKGDMTDMPSLAYRYYLRHFKNNDEYISGNGTDIVSLNDNVIRLTPTSNQSTALFNEFVERANPSIRKASDYKNNNTGTFGDSNIPIQNISLYQGVENGVFKVAPIEQFNDNTDVYPVRNIRKAFSAPIKNIDVSFDVNPTYPNSAGINYRTRLEYRKISNDYETTFNEIALDNIDNLIEEAELIKDTKLVDKLQDFKKTGKYNSFYGLEYDLSDLPSYSNISDKAFSRTKSLNKQYFEQIDNELILLDSIFQEKQKQYPSLFRDDFGTYTWYYNNIKDKLSKYNVTDVNDSTYNISNLNAAILDNKMVLGNPNGGVFIGKFLDISKPLLDSLNAYLLKNPSWLARPDLGSFDQYRLDSPSLRSYLRQYFEHPDQNDSNVFVVGTTQPNKLWSNSYTKGGPIVSPYGQWKYPGKDTIIPSNNITMDNVNYPVLGVSDTGDTKVMIPWNDYKFRGSMVYEHPLIGNQFQLGGNTKPTFNLWYPTIPNQKNDTSSYDLRRAYNTLPFDEMEKFRTINDYHLPSVAYDEKTDTYTFLKRNGHPTLDYELDWYNSGTPDALEFRERYKLDTLSLPWRYIPNIFLTGGLVKKPEPIYNENGQVIGRRYVNKDNPKVIDSVVPQGRVNFQEFLKAKGRKARATNFEDLELFLDSLIARGYNEPLRLAFLATSYNEMDNKGAASRGIGGNGYMGFNTIRMPLNLLNDSSKQIQYILNDTEKLTPDNWTDGGSGGPYIKNLTDAFNKFWNETNPNTATLVLNKANIRPAKQSDWYLRASDADLMKQYMEYPELSKEEEQKQKKSNKLLDSFVDFILSGGLQNTPSYADGGNLFKKGGSGIHIKPENRGKFTRLKKRTGHSASWFKAHGTPALRKMATFALNAKKWHHKDEGGYLDDIIWDNMGLWNPRNYGKPTGIQGDELGTYIVNNDDPQNLVAVDNYGNTRFIPANTRGPFYFPGSSVVEYPLKYQKGGHLLLEGLPGTERSTAFDKWRQYMEDNTIDVPMIYTLPEAVVTSDAPKPGDKNYDRYIANTYDAWQRRDLFTPNGDVDINTLPPETRNRVRGYRGTIAALEGMDEAGSKLFPYVLSGLLGGAPAVATLAGAGILDSTINNATQGESETWGLLLNNTFNLNAGPIGMFALETSNPMYWLYPAFKTGTNVTKVIKGDRIPEFGIKRYANDVTLTPTKQLSHYRSNRAVRHTINLMLENGYHDATSKKALRDLGRNMTYRTGDLFDAMLSLDANGAKQFRIVAPRYDNWSINHELGHNVDFLGDHLSWRQTKSLAPGYNYFEGVKAEDIPDNIIDIARKQVEEQFADIFANTYSTKLPFDFNTTPGLKGRINSLNGYTVSGTGLILDNGFGLKPISASYYDYAPIHDLLPNEYQVLNKVPDLASVKNAVIKGTNKVFGALKPNSIFSKYKMFKNANNLKDLYRTLSVEKPVADIYTYHPYIKVGYTNYDGMITPQEYRLLSIDPLAEINSKLEKAPQLRALILNANKIIGLIDKSVAKTNKRALQFIDYIREKGIINPGRAYTDDLAYNEVMHNLLEEMRSGNFAVLSPENGINWGSTNTLSEEKIPIEFNGVKGTKDIVKIGQDIPLVPDDFGYMKTLTQEGKIPNKYIREFEISGRNSESITGAVKQRLDEATSAAGDNGIVVGSTRLIAHGDISGVPHDIEFLTTRSRRDLLAKQIEFTETGKTAKGTGVTGESKFGPTDINIIEEDEFGIHGRQASEYLSNMFPQEYREWKKAIADTKSKGFKYFPKVKDGKFVFDPKDPSGSELMTGDEFYELIKDELNVRLLLLSDAFSVTSNDIRKQKFAERAVSLLVDKDKTGLVKSVLERKGRALFGKDYKPLTEQYPNLNLQDVAANKKFLNHVGLPEYFADNPEIMNNIIEEWVMEMESVTRGIKAPDVGSAKDALLTNYAYTGGSYSGPGGNVLTHSTGGGADDKVEYIGMMRSNIIKNRNTVKNVSNLVDEVVRLLDDVVGEWLNSQTGNKELNAILKKNKVAEMSHSLAFEHLGKGNLWTDIIFNHINNTRNDLTLQERLVLAKDVINQIADKAGITAIRTHGYDKTYVGVYDIPDVISYQMIEPKFRSEFGYEPGNIFKTNTGEIIDKNTFVEPSGMEYDPNFNNEVINELQKLLDQYGAVVKSDNPTGFEKWNIRSKERVIALNSDIVKKTNKAYQYYAKRLKDFEHNYRNWRDLMFGESWNAFNRKENLKTAAWENERELSQLESYRREYDQLSKDLEEVLNLENAFNNFIKKIGKNPESMTDSQKLEFVSLMEKLHDLRRNIEDVAKVSGGVLGAAGAMTGLLYGTLKAFEGSNYAPFRESDITEETAEDYEKLSNVEFKHKYNGKSKRLYKNYIESKKRYGLK